MRTMFDAVAKPIASGIALTVLHMDHVVEEVEAGPIGNSQIPRWVSSHRNVLHELPRCIWTQPSMQESLLRSMDAMSHSTNINPSTVFHDRTRPLSNNSGHCLEAHTGSYLEDEDTATLANWAMSHSTTVIPSTVIHDRIQPLLTNSGHCLEKRKVSNLEDEDTATSLRHLIWNSITQNRLLQLKNQFPIDVFNSFVARLRHENTNHIDERSSGGHDYIIFILYYIYLMSCTMCSVIHAIVLFSECMSPTNN
jgi:hypothetical protein